MSRFTIHDLAATIDARAASGGEASYTRKLLDKGAEHCAKKLGEEAVETVIAAVENRGLVVDHTSRVGAMLERTGKDIGRDRRIYLKADVIEFCSAAVSRATMEADDPRAGQPLAKVDRESMAQIGPARLDPLDAAAVEDMGEAADGSFNFGKLGHATVIARSEATKQSSLTRIWIASLRSQ